ncbi:chromosome segregation SMC family protein [Pseudoalteromonas fuliginea]|uniref:Chromosome partition protein Smc n=1 Tax=Pseudoalteromonas fuliginea TaxID=1872678 RepID=A0ABD3YAI9_9GAMM|nr:AAA family ATPase [Pseudoalteromonas fuliginea]KDC51670.1 chromosome segregation protein SMC [Pseudoalteromonas fuliginea]KJZ28476.1 chromosome segregation protein SMC [Pseudoalteromonas fuliginea]
MRLSTIKLAGFKSFVEPTKIPFPDQMTCVVGPNGCGKSNVIDAVRWVLGESSAKNLRGDAMTDVIFNGSTNRKAISQASVELVFDNDKGSPSNTFADRNQIAIKRLVTRDGQSLYFLNGSKCRKRDITDIFLGTGLGPRSYAIIEQGMISRLIESKPQELRVFLEEAAGVSKYKERRRETQTRIKSTRENLERLLDVRKELQSQLDKLAVQSVDAKKYRELKAQERTLKGQIAVLKWQKLHQQQLEKSAQIKKLNDQILFFKTANSGHDDVLASLEGQVQAQQDKLSDAQHQQHVIHTELTRAEQQQINVKQQTQTLKQNLIKLQQRQIHSTEVKSQQQIVCEQLNEALQEASENALICEEQVSGLTHELEDLLALKQRRNTHWQALCEQQQQLNNNAQLHSSHIKQTQQQISHVNEQLNQLNSQLSELQSSDVEQQLTQQTQQTQTLTQELAAKQTAHTQCSAKLEVQNELVNNSQKQYSALTQTINELKASITGLKSTLGLDEENENTNVLFNQLSVKEGFEPLIEQALKSLEHLNVSEQQADNSVWPISTKQIAENSLAAFVTSGVYPEHLTRIAYSESGDVTLLNDDFYIAVMDENGAMHGRNWHVSADRNAENSLLLKHKQLQDKTQQLTSAEDELKQITSTRDEHTAKQVKLTNEQSELKEAIHELAQNIAVASTRSDMLVQQVAQFKLQLEKLQQQKQQLTTQHLQLNTVLGEQTAKFEVLNEQQFNLADEVDAANSLRSQSDKSYSEALSMLEQYKTQAHKATLSEQKARSEWQLSQTKLSHAEKEHVSASEGAQELLSEIEELLIPEQELSDKITQLLAQHQKGEQALVLLQKELAQAKESLNTKQVSLKNSQGELVGLQQQHQKLTIEEQSLLIKAQAALEPLEELKQSLKAILDELPDSLNLSAAQNQLTGFTNQLDKLGAVNLAAIEEFDLAKARSDYLDNQLDDLTKALNTLEGAIRKIDIETKTRFKATFDQVNEDFAELFPKVFGGGSAYLELTSDDLLESGVSIMARPPGKKNSTIHLLSGGEKALTALSLVFSIFRLNPAPFCMLDEVDAPLDDANVVRFCRLVEEMSQSVQFIYISHNKIAMEMAGRLTGVTMAEPGVSRMVAVDIEQAVQLAHV